MARSWWRIGSRTYALPHAGTYRFGVFRVPAGANVIHEFGVVEDLATREIRVPAGSKVDFVVASHPFRKIFRTGAFHANRILFVRNKGNVGFDVADAGKVITLDKQVDSPVDLCVNGRVVGRGTLVAVGDQFGVRVTEIDAH